MAVSGRNTTCHGGVRTRSKPTFEADNTQRPAEGETSYGNSNVKEHHDI